MIPSEEDAFYVIEQVLARESVIEMVPADAKVIPGHGPLSDVAGLRTFHQMLTETTQYVRDRAVAAYVEVYERAMEKAFRRLRADGIQQIAFGDIFLDDLRAYRERHQLRSH